MQFRPGIPTMSLRPQLQRLFSMFPGGWPGLALLILRLAVSGLLIQDAISGLLGQSRPEVILHHLICGCAGLFLAVGLWTPIVGMVVAVVEVWTALLGTVHWRSVALLAIVGVALAMLGPGTWSIDARLFGRKRIDIVDP